MLDTVQLTESASSSSRSSSSARESVSRMWSMTAVLSESMLSTRSLRDLGRTRLRRGLSSGGLSSGGLSLWKGEGFKLKEDAASRLDEDDVQMTG